MYDSDEEDDLSKIKLNTWGKLLSIIAKRKKSIIVLLILGILLASLDVALPLINEYVLSNFFEHQKYELIPNYILMNLIYILVFGVTVISFIYTTGLVETSVSYDLRKLAFDKLQRLPFSFYDKNQHGWLMARMTSDTRKLSEILSWGLLNLVWSSFLLIEILVVLYIKYTLFGIIITLAIPLLIILSLAFRKRILKYNRIGRRYNSQSTSKYNESFSGAKTTKALSIETNMLGEYKDIAGKIKKYSIKGVVFSGLFISVLLMSCYIVVGILSVLGANEVIIGVIEVPLLYVAIDYVLKFIDPILVMSRSFTNLQQAQASAERVINLIVEEPVITDTNEVIEKYGDLFDDKVEQWEEIKGNIEVKDVSFAYKEDQYILKDFNLEIKAGQSIAIVGHTGSGKTTLVNLLCRFYEPLSGYVLLDGKDYRERSIHWLHKKLGYVLQDPFLFSSTIKENIKYGNLQATDEEVIASCKLIGCHDFIMSLEKQYDTLLEENGSNLSIGQKQLLCFARAIIADPRILILDEATSSIDSETESKIQEAITTLLKGRTSIIVAHRLSTIINCDKIIVMEQGKIVEEGNHKQLLELKGRYYSLYRNQFIQDKSKELELKF
jgi:ATP-binding cassette subfamily B protein